jgi:hypothetical protein
VAVRRMVHLAPNLINGRTLLLPLPIPSPPNSPR